MLGSNGSAAVVALPSNSVSHAFEPREEAVVLAPRMPSLEAAVQALELIENVVLPPNQYLCQHCNLAEAAHLETLSGEQR